MKKLYLDFTCAHRCKWIAQVIHRKWMKSNQALSLKIPKKVYIIRSVKDEVVVTKKA